MVKENDIALWVLKIITMIQGGFLIGIVAAIIFYYVRKTKRLTLLHVHIVAVSTSHLLLVFATMRTMWKALYNLTDIWFLTVFIAYLLSNFALLVMFAKLKEERRLEGEKPIQDADK